MCLGTPHFYKETYFSDILSLERVPFCAGKTLLTAQDTCAAQLLISFDARHT